MLCLSATALPNESCLGQGGQAEPRQTVHFTLCRWRALDVCKGDTFVPISCLCRKPEHIFTPRWLEELFSPALWSVCITHCQHLAQS